jgi:hypothetical protein
MSHNRSCKVLILLFFSLYAISPIVYGINANGVPDASSGKAASLSPATLYLIEVLYDAITGSSDQGDREPGQHILVLKKKALHRGRTNGVDTTRSAVKVALALEPLPLRPLFRRNCALLPVFSGLSPPGLS